MFESDKFENFSLASVLFFHDFKHYIRFFRFGDINSVKFLIIKINSVFVMSFAHLAIERFPVNSDTEIIDDSFDLFR